MVFRYSRWALERDEEMATKIFTERKDSEELNSEKVLDFLSPFPIAAVSYLEHIIHGKGSKVNYNKSLCNSVSCMQI